MTFPSDVNLEQGQEPTQEHGVHPTPVHLGLLKGSGSDQEDSLLLDI